MVFLEILNIQLCRVFADQVTYMISAYIPWPLTVTACLSAHVLLLLLLLLQLVDSMSEVGVVNCLATDATYTDDTPVNYVFPQQPLKGKVSINNNNNNNRPQVVTCHSVYDQLNQH